MELGQGRGHGDQPPSRGGFKALPAPRSSLALPAPCAMRVLSLLLLLGLCCLWARLVASGERGTGPWGVPTQRAERGCAPLCDPKPHSPAGSGPPGPRHAAGLGHSCLSPGFT